MKEYLYKQLSIAPDSKLTNLTRAIYFVILLSIITIVLESEPSISYGNLEINNGSLASFTFANLHNLSDLDQINKTRKHLLEYCKLDTLAMVKILEVLRSV